MNFDSLKDQVSNLTLYDLKAGVRKVQNGEPLYDSWDAVLDIEAYVLCPAVMNYTEMESKVPSFDRSARQSSSPRLPGSGSYE